MKKRTKIILLTVISIMLIVPMVCELVFLINSEKDEMPTVILGGFGAYTEFTQESFYSFKRDREYSFTDKINQDDTIAQLGDYPIFSNTDLKMAFSTLKNTSMPAKKIVYHKLYSYNYFDSYMTKKITEDDFKVISRSSAKVCFLDPATNLGVCFGHPIGTGDVSGAIFKAEFDKLDNENSPNSISFIKSPTQNPQIVGTIVDHLNCGVVFKYDPTYFADEKNKKIQIAKNSEVTLGKAYIYTDYGKGLNLYEIKIVDLTGTNDSYSKREDKAFITDQKSPFGSYEKLNISTDKTFGFIITDENMIKDGIDHCIGGTSGSPIIQNDKLIGFVCKANNSYNNAYYAETAYNEIMESQKNKNAPYKITASDSRHPLVYVSPFPITYVAKGTGAIVQNVSPENLDIKTGDTIIAIDNKTFFNHTSINNALSRLNKDGKSEVELTILRGEHIFEIMVDTANTKIESFSYNTSRSGAISMIDPVTYRYAGSAVKDVLYYFNPFSGILVKCKLTRENGKQILETTNQVCGTIDSAGYTAYGFLEPFNIDDEALVEIAEKKEVQNGEAVIYLFSGNNEISAFNTEYVSLECEDNKIVIKPSEKYTHNRTLEESLLRGSPIYQNGRLVGVYYKTKENDPNTGYAYYAIDVYNEMMNIK